MRIWSLHPKYLDSKGMVALWRETLLAQNVLLGKTKGYKNHPQLDRFRAQKNPVVAIGNYLQEVQHEAVKRNFNFDETKIISQDKNIKKITVTTGQIQYEFKHLKQKLQIRDLNKYLEVNKIKIPELHPSFILIEGEIEEWEKNINSIDKKR